MARVRLSWQKLSRSGPLMLLLYLGCISILRGAVFLFPQKSLGGMVDLVEALSRISEVLVWSLICFAIGAAQVVASLRSNMQLSRAVAHIAFLFWLFLTVVCATQTGTSPSFVAFSLIMSGNLLVWVTLSYELR